MKARLPAERRPGFTYQSPGLHRARELFADDVPITRLAEKYGTPLYIYSGSAIRARFEAFDKAFAKQAHTVCYSVKANSNLALLRMLAKLGAGFDVVSVGELHRVLAASPKAANTVVFSGVGKRADEIDLALQARILLFNVESASEFKLLAARAAHLRKTAPFAVRVNPDVNAQTHPYISTGLHEHKFGVPLREARELYGSSLSEKHLKAAGVSAHIGSQITDLSTFRESTEKLAEFTVDLRAEGHDIRYLDAGGGLGINYQSSEGGDFATEVRSYARQLLTPLKDLGVHLLLEPGRSIVGPAGILVARIVYKKRNDGKLFLVTDAAMNDLLRPALYEAYHEVVPVAVKKSAGKTKADVVGPVCESSDFLAIGRELPEMEEGELLALLDTGAYGMVLASNYNTRPRAAEVMVEGKRAHLIRRRETLDDLLAPERI